MEVTNHKGETFELTDKEEKFLKAIKRIQKMDSGRLKLFGNGLLSVRLGGYSYYRTIHDTRIICEGGDGGDDFD